MSQGETRFPRARYCDGQLRRLLASVLLRLPGDVTVILSSSSSAAAALASSSSRNHCTSMSLYLLMLQPFGFAIETLASDPVKSSSSSSLNYHALICLPSTVVAVSVRRYSQLLLRVTDNQVLQHHSRHHHHHHHHRYQRIRGSV